MARRKKNEGLVDLLFELPWWAALFLGLVMLIISTGSSNTLARLIFIMFAFVCFATAFASGIKALSQKVLFASAIDIEAIRAMSWREFETLVGEAYRRQGYRVEETGGGGADGGVDLVLRGKGQKIIVQCKQWKTYKVGVKIVREMYGVMVAEKADCVIIVASGAYTQDSVTFARGKPIKLMDGKALVQLIREVKGHPTTSAPAPPPAPPTPSANYPKTMNVQTVAAPGCPRCGSTMVLRTAKRGLNTGNQFWGCPRYPACKGIVNLW